MKKIYLFGASAAALVLLVSVCIAARGGILSTAQIALSDIALLLLISIVLMVAALRHSLRQTLYSYKNIGLYGGILFAAVLYLALSGLIIAMVKAESISFASVCRTVLNFPRHFSYYAAFVILLVSLALAVSNIALIRHEGFRPGNLLSLLVAGFYIGGTVGVYHLSDYLRENVFIERGLLYDPLSVSLGTAVPLFLLLMLCYFECILVGSAIMGFKAARQQPHYDKDFIIILGCSVDPRGGLLPLLRGRVNRAIRFAWEQEIASGKPLKYVPSGGKGTNEIMSEGSAMELYLKSHGAEDEEVFPEKMSVSTRENMLFSKEIIDELKPGATVAFATTNYHMLRSGILARRAGMDAEGIAGDTKWYFWPNGFIREFFAILALNMRAHGITAAAAFALSLIIALLEYFGIVAA